MTIGQRLKQRRTILGIRAGKDDGYSQKEVADAAGVTQAHYSFVEADVRRPTLWPLIALAEFYGMSLEEAFPEYRMTPREKRVLLTARNASRTILRAS